VEGGEGEEKGEVKEEGGEEVLSSSLGLSGLLKEREGKGGQEAGEKGAAAVGLSLPCGGLSLPPAVVEGEEKEESEEDGDDIK
jgi:hypothetical protein